MRKKKELLISILITNYNKDKFIKKTLLSTIKQSYNNYEILIYDDQSTDSSFNIINNYHSNKKVKIFKNKSLKSISAPINQMNSLINCFKKSKGKIICFLDSDDIFIKNKLKKINNFFLNNPTKSFVVNKLQNDRILNLKRMNFNKKKWPSIFPTSCISVKRSFFKKFLKFSKKNDLLNLEIDSRMIIFTCFYLNDFNVLDYRLTNYILDKKGISSDYNFLSLKWWLKRREAYMYLEYILKTKKKKIEVSFDYFITCLMYKILSFLKLK